MHKHEIISFARELKGNNNVTPKIIALAVEIEKEILLSVKSYPLDNYKDKLSKRTYNALKISGITDLKEFNFVSIYKLSKDRGGLRNFGSKGRWEIIDLIENDKLDINYY